MLTNSWVWSFVIVIVIVGYVLSLGLCHLGFRASSRDHLRVELINSDKSDRIKSDLIGFHYPVPLLIDKLLPPRRYSCLKLSIFRSVFWFWLLGGILSVICTYNSITSNQQIVSRISCWLQILLNRFNQHSHY